MLTIAARLKFAREKKGWTQTQLAVAAGVSAGTVGNIESGARQSKGSLPQIAEALDINHKWLSLGVGSPTSPDLPALSGGSGGPVSLEAAIAVLADAIERSQYKGQDNLLGMLAYMGKSPGDEINRQAIAALLQNKQKPDAPAQKWRRDGRSNVYRLDVGARAIAAL